MLKSLSQHFISRKGPSENETRLFIVRHAEHVKPMENSLSSYGSMQAAALGEILRRHGDIAAVISSLSCKETAEIIAVYLGIEVTYDDRLRRWDRGILNGLSLEDVRKKMPEVYQKRYVERNPMFKVPEGESLQDRHDRVLSVLNDILKHHPGEQVVIVTHGGVIDDLYRIACKLPLPQLTGLLKPYGCMSVLLYSHNEWREEQWASAEHLPQVVAESPTGGHLYLFPHQVAGSVPFLRGDRGELCKPANHQELQVYELMNREDFLYEIVKFTPVYIGTVEIDVKHILKDMLSLSLPLTQMGENGNSSNGENNNNNNNNVAITPASAGALLLESRKRTSLTNLAADLSNSGIGAVSSSESRKVTTASLSNNNNNNNNFEIGNGTLDLDKLADSLVNEENTGTIKSRISSMVKDTSFSRPKSSVSRVPSIQIDASNDAVPMNPTITSPTNNVPAGKSQFSVTNLWNRFAQGRWKKVVTNEKTDRSVFLLIENLSHGMRRPYVLDLKMGFRQHAPDESADKIKRKESRVKQTTSYEFGARVGGMKMYSKQLHRYVLKDKYWGRSLDLKGFKQAMREFVSFDVDIDQENSLIRESVVRKIVYQLERFVIALKECKWRFYGSSLLIVYESDTSSAGFSFATTPLKCRLEKNQPYYDPDDHEKVAIRLIDFSHTATEMHDTCDEGFVLGVENLINLFNSFLVPPPSLEVGDEHYTATAAS